MGRLDRVSRNRVSRRAFLYGTGALAAGAAGGAMVGCGGGDGEPAGPTATPGGQPKRGGTYRLAVGQLGELDPHTTSNPYSCGVFHLTNNHVVRISASTLVPEPDLAESWEFPEEEVTLFHFHPDVLWQNLPPLNGRAFDAEDAVYSIDRSRTPLPEFLRRTNYDPVETVEAPDAATLRIVTSGPYAPLLSVMGDQYEVVVAKELVDKYGDLKRSESMIGTGPYELGRYDSDVGFALSRRADPYFKPDTAWLDAIEMNFIANPQAAKAAFRSGQLEQGGVDELDIESARAAHPDLNITQTSLLTRELLLLNLNQSPFDDERVRMAVNRAVDRDQMVNTVWSGNGIAVGPVSPVLTEWAIPEEEFRAMPGYLTDKEEDIAEAKRLLEDAGFPDGFETTITTTETFDFGKVAQVLQVQLEKVGIKADIEVLDFGALIERIQGADFRMAVISSPTGGADPDQQMYSFYHSNGSYNQTGYSDDETDRLLEEQRSETDVERRKEIVLELQRRLIEHPAGHLWLTSRGGMSITQPYVMNHVPSVGSIFAFYTLEDVWLDQ